MITAALAVALVVTHINSRLVGFSSGEGISILEWLLRAAVTYGPLGLLMLHSDGVLRAMAAPPVRWRTLMMVWAIVSAPFVDRPGFSILIAAMVLATVGLPAWYTTRVGWHRFVDVVTITVGGIAAASLVAGVAGLPYSYDDASGFARLQGVFGHPNRLAQAAVLCLLFAWHQRRRGKPWLALGVAVAGGSTLALAQSRTALAALALGVAWIIYRESTRATRTRTAIIVLLLATAITEVGFDVVASSLSRTGDASDIATATGRTVVWSALIPIAAEQPLTGYGLGTDRIAEAASAATDGWEAHGAHNDLLSVFFLFGVPGVALWLAMIVSYVRRARAHPDTLRDALMICCLTLGLAEVAVGPTFPSLMHYVLVGCLAAASLSPAATVMRGHTMPPANAANLIRGSAAGASATAVATAAHQAHRGTARSRRRARG